jgi:hypothetical protein
VDYNRTEFVDTTKGVAWWAGVIFVGAVVVSIASVGVKIITAPANVVSKTLDTSNIINKYEWYYDASAQYTARLAQVKAHAHILAEESDPKEKSRIRIELSGMQQSCRDLATKYNANSEKANQSIFKSSNLPSTLSVTACEV